MPKILFINSKTQEQLITIHYISVDRTRYGYWLMTWSKDYIDTKATYLPMKFTREALEVILKKQVEKLVNSQIDFIVDFRYERIGYTDILLSKEVLDEYYTSRNNFDNKPINVSIYLYHAIYEKLTDFTKLAECEGIN
jgi:hypothetical protein